MPRAGVQFEKPAPSVQASLDRFVFGLMRRRTLAEPAGTTRYAEQRIAPRVEIGEGEPIEVSLLPAAPRSLLPRPPGPGIPLKLIDLSTTGCGFACPDPAPVKAGERIRLHLRGKDLDIELHGKVVYVRPDQVG